MKPIRTLIADDEPLARENIRLRLAAYPDFTVVAECDGGEATIAAVTEHTPDVLFLDIRMPDLDGFEVVAGIPPARQPVVVFVTAFDRYALDAFRVHALDYLLKPFSDDRFAETVARVREQVEQRRQEPAGTERWQADGLETPCRRLVIRGRGRIHFVKVEDIDWIEACGDYARVHTGGEAYLLRRTLGDMVGMLEPQRFARVSRSAIVNLDRIAELRPQSRGEFLVRLRAGDELKLTRTYRPELEALLGQRL